MLDRASIERLSKTPEKNAPLLNVALAEEGRIDVLCALARCASLGPEAIEVIAARREEEGTEVGRDADAGEDFVSRADELDRLLVAHPRAPRAVLDAVLSRHEEDPFFVLAAAAHARASLEAIERAALWPSASSVHDRLWLALLDADAIPPLAQEEWASDASSRKRETIARITREAALLEALTADASRRVRRAIASNRFAGDLRAKLAESDHAPEVRARAAGPLSAHTEGQAERASIVDSARFAAALRAMESGGVLAPDVVRALSIAADLDDEGALIAAQVLPRAEVLALSEQVIDLGPSSSRAVSLAAGLALRPPSSHGPNDGDGERELTEIVYDAVKCLSRVAVPDSHLTGKARLAAWVADGVAHSPAVDRTRLMDDLARGPIAAERMILARCARSRPDLVGELCEAAKRCEIVPGALIELAWADAAIDDAAVVELAARIAKPKKRAEDLPEDEIDLDPSLRSLAVLERVVLAAVLRTNVSPRAALAVTALDSRRVRYVLSAMPQWKGRITGGHLARVLRHHAGALSAARAEGRTRSAKVETWTERLMHEIELSVALAVGHLTAAEVANRIASGQQKIEDGLTLGFAAEARAALEGSASASALVAWASKARTQNGPGFAVWLLLERLDRERTPALVATALDGIASGAQSGAGVVHPSVADALATIERRRPGRLETIHAQSPRGRATLASAIARAYRAVGGMRDERQ